MKKIILLIISIQLGLANLQAQRPMQSRPHPDSMAINQTRYWAKTFNLSKVQQNQLQAAFQKMYKQNDSIRLQSITNKGLGNQKQNAKKIRNEHRNELKKIFTKKQWDAYKEAQQKQQKAYSERMKQSNRKITVDADDDN